MDFSTKFLFHLGLIKSVKMSVENYLATTRISSGKQNLNKFFCWYRALTEVENFMKLSPLLYHWRTAAYLRDYEQQNGLTKPPCLGVVIWRPFHALKITKTEKKKLTNACSAHQQGSSECCRFQCREGRKWNSSYGNTATPCSFFTQNQFRTQRLELTVEQNEYRGTPT
jgi:hypothetical protein